ncbi:MAG TPA: hypothetical protein DCE42_20780 [Myxococcales bacterium]|nr:hypothetical protein [Deltaproteobacteria bacterium]MBU47343.1 hypothetical protein [Deltaproteobacteria bacterium]HAA57214.1 hypothetical protein [Myxococcales bacterium]|tara:strand:+ start:20815 stop:21657 length:843 start_codon:yes stop_codon:yes gene_type:complete
MSTTQTQIMLSTRSFFLVLLAFCSTLGLLSCTTDTPAPQSEIRSLRILGIRAEPPDVLPGKEFLLTALVATPDAKTVTLRWVGCTKPGEAARGCLESDKAKELGSEASVTYKSAASYIPEDASLLDQFRGKYLPVTLVASVGDEREQATKRIVITKLPTNKNPTITSFALTKAGSKQVIQEPWEVKAGQTYRLTPGFDEEDKQSYPGLDQSGEIRTLQEKLFFSWYVTGGALKGGRSSDDTKPHKDWVAPGEPGTVYMYVIVRDGRGGTHWVQRTLNVTQ